MRQIVLLDKNWTFYKNPDSAKGQEVTLPHTWNAIDGQDGGNDYYRGTCKYVKTFQKPEVEEGRKSLSGIRRCSDDRRRECERQKACTP